jgi:energy-coupling factor transporter ATP-binding protein EcfA2
MLSIAQAAARRGSAGVPLPNMYEPLRARGIEVCKGQLSLIAAPPGAGKSTLAMNLMVRMGVPTLAFLLDTDQLSAAARFGSIVTGDVFGHVKRNIDSYHESLSSLRDTQVVFSAMDMDDIRLQVSAYEQRYGLPPDLVLVDNLGNLTSAMDNEWALLKALCLELDLLAREMQMAVVACAHMTDLETTTPAGRTKLLGKVSQYPRLILSIGYDPGTWEYKISAVKNSSGPSDMSGTSPVTMWADFSRMRISETDPRWTPSGRVDDDEPPW